jgi:hypothetical protein
MNFNPLEICLNTNCKLTRGYGLKLVFSLVFKQMLKVSVELILKVPFFLTILWDELLSKNLGIFVLCTKMTRLSQELTSVNS